MARKSKKRMRMVEIQLGRACVCLCAKIDGMTLNEIKDSGKD